MSESGNFRSRLFGGFDRHDVSAYITALAAERNELKAKCEKLEAETNALREQYEAETNALREQLKDETDALREKLEAETDALREQLKDEADVLREKLEAETNALREQLKDEADVLRKRTEAAEAAVEAEKRRADDFIITERGEAAEELRSLILNYDSTSVDLEMAVQHVRSELLRTAEDVSLISVSFTKAGERLNELLASVAGSVGETVASEEESAK